MLTTIKELENYEKLSLTLVCFEHILNYELNKETWDNPYNKEDAMHIIKKLYPSEYNEDYINKPN